MNDVEVERERERKREIWVRLCLLLVDVFGNLP